MSFPEHFKPYTPNANTKLGRAYLCAAKDCEGSLLATEANFLRENPLLWLRAISLYSANMDFAIRQAKTRLKAMAPLPGEVFDADYVRLVRDSKNRSVRNEHLLQKVKARRAELVVELGYQDIREVLLTGDIVGILADLLAALRQEDWVESKRLAEYWMCRLTGMDMDGSEDVMEKVKEDDGLSLLMARVRGESDGDAAQG
jgi:hypothetical protein